MLGHILSDYRVILHVILHVLNLSVCLQLTHRSRKYGFISIHPLLGPGVWGGVREIERDAHNANKSFEKTDFVVAVEKNNKQMTAHKRRI